MVHSKDMWNQRYSMPEYFYGKLPNDFLKLVAARLKPSSNILCLGDGEGRNAVYLATLGHQVTSVDLSSVGADKMKLLAKEKNVSVEALVADLADFDLGICKWDAIVSIWCHLPPATRKLVYKKIPAALKKNGILIMESYTPEQLKYKTGGPPDQDMMLTKDLVLEELSPLYFEILEEKIRNVQEGGGHNGASAVIQVFAKA